MMMPSISGLGHSKVAMNSALDKTSRSSGFAWLVCDGDAELSARFV
jgi:hypothetical protein